MPRTGRLRFTRSPAASPCRNAPFTRAHVRLPADTSRISVSRKAPSTTWCLISMSAVPVEHCAATLAFARPVHVIKAIRDAGRHALLEALRCTSKSRSPQPRMCRPECLELSPHGAVDDAIEITGECRVTLETEEYVARDDGVPRRLSR
jgi:hypothetical protein